MRLPAIAIALLALPSVAHARPITAGVGYGAIESKADASAGSNTTLGLFGRLGFTPRLAGQLELQRIETDNQNTDIRSATGLLVVDLASHSHLVPILLAGAGFDRASTSYGDSTDAHHIEGGFGLEYRADGGLTIGGDVRMGGRSIDSTTATAYPFDRGVALYAPSSTLQDGEYRSARLFVGVRF